MALLSNTAATEESTPPDKPKTTLSLPNCSRRLVMVLSMNEAGDQSFLHPHICKKLSKTS